MVRRWSALAILLGTLMLAGCNSRQKPIPTPTHIPPLEGAQTLPPTWTPTASWTPAPTRTPTVIPSATATLSAEDICASFQLIVSPLPATRIDFGGVAMFAWKNAVANSPLVILIAPRHGGKGVQTELNIPYDVILPFPMNVLPYEGEYTWSIWLQHPVYGQICLHKGTIQRLSPVF